MPDGRFHDLRHNFASLPINNRRSLYEVQHLLGHTQARTTQRYAHLSNKTLQDATDTVSAALKIEKPTTTVTTEDVPDVRARKTDVHKEA